ncbi:hypothetical protein ACDX78_02630 [Virgibacillus oceani]
MKKESFSKIKTYLLIIISLVLIITGVQLYQKNQESQRQYESFLNQFYFKLESAMSSLDTVLEQELEGNNLARALLQIDQSLEQADLILNAGSRFVDREIYGHTLLFSNHPINQFAENNTLAEEELQYLENLKKDLETIQTGLYSDETGQENPNLNARQFNDVIRGSGLESGFLTEHKSIPVPFQVIEPEQAPERIQKWLEKNESVEQSKAFLVDGKTYVLAISGYGEDGLNQVEITDMVLKRGGIDVTHQIVQSDDAKQEDAVAIAELEEMERSFQFTTSVEIEEEFESTGRSNTAQAGAEAFVELVPPEKLSEDGQIVDE